MALDPLLPYNLAAQLLECARERVAELPNVDTDPVLDGAPERVSVWPGTPSWAICPAGEMYAYLERIYPSSETGFPGQVAGVASCSADTAAITIVVGIVRCWFSMDDNAEDHPVAEINRISRQVYADAWAVWRGVFCCINSEEWRESGLEAVIIETRPIQPQTVVGSELRITVGPANDCLCAPIEPPGP